MLKVLFMYYHTFGVCDVEFVKSEVVIIASV